MCEEQCEERNTNREGVASGGATHLLDKYIPCISDFTLDMPKYNDDILNYYNDDSHIGSLDADAKDVGTGLVGAPACGDVMKLQIKVKNDKIVDAKIMVFGCGSAKASSSYVAKKLTGMTLNEALQIKNTDIAEALGLPRIKLHCSVLAEDAIKRAVEDYKKKQSSTKKATKTTKKVADFSIDITKEAIEFTLSHLQKLEKDDKKIKGIRLSLEEGHCGLMYKVRYVENKDDTSNFIDYIAKAGRKQLHIFVQNDMAEILNKTKIEYKEENLKRGLVFTNPRETGRCSCGKNFFTSQKKNV